MSNILSNSSQSASETKEWKLRRRQSDKDSDWRNPNELFRAFRECKISKKVFLSIISALPQENSDHGNPVRIFEELRKWGASDSVIAEIMEFFSCEDIVILGDEDRKMGNIPIDFCKEENEEIDPERIDMLEKLLGSKKGKKLSIVNRADMQKDDALIFRFSKKKREGDDIIMISFDIALLVEYTFSATLVCLVQTDDPIRNGNVILKNSNIRLPIFSEGGRQFDGLIGKIGHHFDEERRSMLSERYLREIILISNYQAKVKALWTGIKKGVGGILGD